MDNYLHSAGASTCHAPQEAAKFRTLLDDGIKRLTESIAGGLQGPLLKKDGIVSMLIDADSHPDLKDLLVKGDLRVIRIEVTPFLDSP